MRTIGSAIAFGLAVTLLTSACGAGGSAGGDDETVTIGLSAGFSGAAAFYGQNSKKGIDLAVAELNKDAEGPKYELVTADDECTAQGGVSAYRQLVNQQHVDVVFGSTCSSSTLAGMPILKSSQVPGLVFSAASPKITEQSGKGGNAYTWRMNLDDSTTADAIAELVVDEGSHDIALLAPGNDDWGRTSIRVYKKALPENGGRVAAAEFYEPNSAQLRPQLTKIKSAGADSIMLFGNVPDCVAMVRQMHELGLRLKIYDRGSCATDEAIAQLGKQAGLLDGTRAAAYWMPTKDQKAFLDAFQRKYDEKPDYNAGLAYYAVLTLAKAVETGGADAAGINAGLGKLDWQSPIGPIEFDEHHQAHPHLFTARVEDSKVVVGDPIPTS